MIPRDVPITLHHVATIPILTVSNEFCSADCLDVFKATYSSVMAEGPGGLVIDLTHVEYLTSHGLAAMVLCFRAARLASIKVAFVVDRYEIWDTMLRTGLDRCLSLFRTVEEALEMVQVDPG